VIFCVLVPVCATLFPARSRASQVNIPPDAQIVLDTIYAGHADAATALARAFEQAHPQNPLGYLLEGEALWWERYCAACEIKWDMIEAWRHEKLPEDAAYFVLVDKAIALAEAQLAHSETAELHFLAGMGYALKVRVYGLRNENRLAARAAVAARAHMLRALELDPQMADATGALGLYNYYVDTLSPIVRILRFFMGIPGGDKEKGVEQMQVGMNQGTLLAVDLRFILARALRQYDRKYEQALTVALPLTERYPSNPLFLLLAGNLNAELARNSEAENYVRAALELGGGSACLTHSHAIAASFLADKRHNPQ
jgi:tetratricopeptide (TPR) repeat protein